MPVDHANFWSYRPGQGLAFPEYAVGSGSSAPALATHFHQETQFTLVLSGSRRFEVGAVVVDVPAGHCIAIPPGVPHRSLPHGHAGMRCLNLYAATEALNPALLHVPELLALAEAAHPLALLQALLQRLDTADAAWPAAPAGLRRDIHRHSGPIAAIASRHGLSREAFSRKFARACGMPPHAYRIVSRLNEARSQLRAGNSVVDTAAATGFADQSHFGRHFRRIFGVTPRVYRDGLR